MIPEFELEQLMAYSIRNKDGDMELDLKLAPPEIIELAKQFYWKPFDVVKDENGSKKKYSL